MWIDFAFLFHDFKSFHYLSFLLFCLSSHCKSGFQQLGFFFTDLLRLHIVKLYFFLDLLLFVVLDFGYPLNILNFIFLFKQIAFLLDHQVLVFFDLDFSHSLVLFRSFLLYLLNPMRFSMLHLFPYAFRVLFLLL